ncbi:MAG: HD-GYP domain-containing protein [bacterium]
MAIKHIPLNNFNFIIQTNNKDLQDLIENIIKKSEIINLISQVNQINQINDRKENKVNFSATIYFKELSSKTIISDNIFILSEPIFSSNINEIKIGIIEKENLNSDFIKTLVSESNTFDFIMYYDKENINILYYQIFSILSNLILLLKNNQQKQIEKLIKDVINLKIENEELLREIIYRLSLAAEYKDEYTGAHIKRISLYCNLIAQEMKLDKDFINKITLAAPLHDVGKIGIPDNILLKPGRLTKEEFEIMKTHTIIGAKILDNSKNDLIKFAKEIALYHHEKYNGQGYPFNLKGEQIPLAARIVAIADVFDALTSKRPYKDPYPITDTIDIIKQEINQHFDPEITNIFLKNIKSIIEIRYSYI